MSAVAEITTSEQFKKSISSDNLTIVHFAAPWAPQCNQITDAMTELAKMPEVKSFGTQFYVCPAEDLDEISHKYKVEAVPTVILFKKGAAVDRIDGADVVSLAAKIKTFCPNMPDAKLAEPLEERLKKLINKHRVMVFMKGNREAPRCGFSKTLIQILKDAGTEYETFDILTNEEVRQGLKTYSDWPTYPQVYVQGELIGGLDIIKEMVANGELETTLNP